MKASFRKIAALMMSVCMLVLMLAGCGGGSGGEAEESGAPAREDPFPAQPEVSGSEVSGSKFRYPAYAVQMRTSLAKAAYMIFCPKSSNTTVTL